MGSRRRPGGKWVSIGATEAAASIDCPVTRTDELAEIDDGPIEAAGSTGTSGSQRGVFGVPSQVYTASIAWTLSIFETTVRHAVSPGVGACGTGRYLQEQRSGFPESLRNRGDANRWPGTGSDRQ